MLNRRRNVPSMALFLSDSPHYPRTLHSMSAPYNAPMSNVSPPLTGLRVLDLTRLLPGPLASLILADLGAEVIKIEEPGLGDYVRHSPPFLSNGQGAMYAALNRGKKSIALNLKTEAGRQALLRLLPTADVLLESFRPGVMDKLGLTHGALQAANPQLILVSMSGYGQTGPLKDRAGHDLNYMALSGGLSLSHHMPGVQVADVGGAMMAALSVQSALLGRLRHGAGFQAIDVSLAESVIPFGVIALSEYLGHQKPIRPHGSTLSGVLGCYQLYTTQDGHTVASAPLEPKFFQKFLMATGLPATLLGAQFSERKQDEVKAEIAAWYAGRTLAQAIAVLEQADACIEPVLSLEEMVNHPHHQARGVFPPPTQDVPLAIRVTPLGLNTTPLAPAPGLGEHNALLASVGYSEEDALALAKQEGKAPGRMM